MNPSARKAYASGVSTEDTHRQTHLSSCIRTMVELTSSHTRQIVVLLRHALIISICTDTIQSQRRLP